MLSRKLAALSLHSKKLNGFRVISLKFGGKSKNLAESGFPELPFLGNMLNPPKKIGQFKEK